MHTVFAVVSVARLTLLLNVQMQTFSLLVLNTVWLSTDPTLFPDREF